MAPKKNSLYILYENFEETIGINDRIALSKAEALMRKRINETHMRNGVTLIDPNNTYIGPEVTIEADVVIEPNTRIQGQTSIGEGTTIGLNSNITDCTIGSNTVIEQSVVEESEIGNDVKIGPFAHIRPSSEIKDRAKIGNFVEVKKAVIGENSKASHLSYLGDAEIGDDVNIGCGAITVNYDGKNKHLTKIEDGAFIGCNANLIAPVTIEKGAYVAAGSTITKNVPEKALSIARVKQTNKEGYVERLNKQKK